ncbi:hypothetical protein BHW_0900044 (plasmid) [Borrelia hermsii MTW]|uniref:Uncharacterized protein n=1 Tax=Borrelia hermsii MTW TaxID=1313291 RepID=W5T6A0_BORHE|nr:hypothetical protein BHW_0900044 [Borrelia hermsii MTW]
MFLFLIASLSLKSLFFKYAFLIFSKTASEFCVMGLIYPPVPQVLDACSLNLSKSLLLPSNEPFTICLKVSFCWLALSPVHFASSLCI